MFAGRLSYRTSIFVPTTLQSNTNKGLFGKITRSDYDGNIISTTNHIGIPLLRFGTHHGVRAQSIIASMRPPRLTKSYLLV